MKATQRGDWPADHPLAGLPRLTETDIAAVLAVTLTKRAKPGRSRTADRKG